MERQEDRMINNQIRREEERAMVRGVETGLIVGAEVNRAMQPRPPVVVEEQVRVGPLGGVHVTETVVAQPRPPVVVEE